MNVFAKILCVSTVLALLAGCASDVAFIPKLPPEAQAKLLDYYEQPDNKVFIIAIDPGGDYAYGYDYGKPTLKQAAKVAAEKCDASREAGAVVARPYIYALNNKVVYEEMIRKAHQAEQEKEDPEMQAQIDEAGRQEDAGEVESENPPAEGAGEAEQFE
jgi:hypothetical protein